MREHRFISSQVYWAWPVVAWRVTILVPLVTPSITPMTEVGQAERTAVTHIMQLSSCLKMKIDLFIKKLVSEIDEY